jgi:hypothetical protein
VLPTFEFHLLAYEWTTMPIGTSLNIPEGREIATAAADAVRKKVRRSIWRMVDAVSG